MTQIITLSNGTKVEQVRQSDDCVLAVVLPDDREMTDAEFAEYASIIAKRSLGKSSKPSHSATVLP